jgi:competence ComEA-like helix-hairpin-helix protein
MRLFDFIHTYFGFNRRERNGLLVLLGIVIVLFLIRISITSFSNEGKEVEFQKLSASKNEIETKLTTKNFNRTNNNTSSIEKNHFFAFDPNTITEEDAIELGFSKKSAATLVKFRSKGGKFKVKEDLKKLYGVKASFYESLKEYIVIEKSEEAKITIKEENKKSAVNLIDLNSTDSIELVKLPKIGPFTAKKIIKFRNALGGFINLEQLNEIYGIKDSVLLILKSKTFVENKNIKPILINKATYEELKRHPYINHIIASTIIAYREKHGNYKEINDLKNVGTLDDKKIEQLKSYLNFN